MKLIALFLGLLIERTATRALHLRELRWLDPYFDAALVRVARLSRPVAYLVAVVAIGLPALPILGLAIAFGDILNGLIYIAFAALVLVFSLGPRDLGREVDEYAEAVENGDQEAVKRLTKELIESDAPGEEGRRVLAVEEAVLVRANNRIFGVIFWFMVLGATGAWLFRVTDLMRRRAVFEAGRARERGDPEPRYLIVVQSLFGLLAGYPHDCWQWVMPWQAASRMPCRTGGRTTKTAPTSSSTLAMMFWPVPVAAPSASSSVVKLRCSRSGPPCGLSTGPCLSG